MERLSIAKEEIRRTVKISALVERLTGKQLKQNRMKCPFHNEKTASFFVNDARGVYYCQGCGTKGDIFTFVMNYNSVSFHDSIRFVDGEFHLGLLNQRISAASMIRAKIEREKRDKEEKKAIKMLNIENELCIDYRIANIAIQKLEPFSNLWCYYMNEKIRLERRLDECMHMTLKN